MRRGTGQLQGKNVRNRARGAGNVYGFAEMERRSLMCSDKLGRCVLTIYNYTRRKVLRLGNFLLIHHYICTPRPPN